MFGFHASKVRFRSPTGRCSALNFSSVFFRSSTSSFFCGINARWNIIPSFTVRMMRSTMMSLLELQVYQTTVYITWDQKVVQDISILSLKYMVDWRVNKSHTVCQSKLQPYQSARSTDTKNKTLAVLQTSSRGGSSTAADSNLVHTDTVGAYILSQGASDIDATARAKSNPATCTIAL
jgi:hypothetical protein